MYAYCNNNPIMYTDYSGDFPWLIVAFLALTTVTGGVLGGLSTTKIGENIDNEIAIPTPDNKLNSKEEDKGETDSELTTGDRVKNIVVGASIGLAAGGAIVAVTGAFLTIGIGTTAIIAGFALTGPQMAALGILTYNTIVLLAPLIGVEIEPIEYGSQAKPDIPNNSGKR